MTDYNAKLQQLRQKLEQRKTADALLAKLNDEKAQLEKQLPELKDTYEKAQRRYEKLADGGLSAIFAKLAGNDEEKLIAAKKEATIAQREYDTAVYKLEKAKSEIQSAFNRAASLRDVKRQYDNLITEIEHAMAEGRNIIDRNVWQQEQTNRLLDEKAQTQRAIAAGRQVLEVLNSIISQSPAGTKMVLSNATNPLHEVDKALIKFKNLLGDIEKSGSLRIEKETDRTERNFTTYNVFRWDLNMEIKPVQLKKSVSTQEMAENLGTTGYQVEQMIAQLENRLEELKSLI